MKLGPLLPQDLDDALALSTAEGWNQTADDWRRLIVLEPAGCFAARDGGRLIGTVTTTTYGGALAWIGMMVVHPDSRRRGVGVALMRMALEYARRLGVASVKLDATPAGRPLYEALGFTADAELERWQGVARIDAGVARGDAGVARGDAGLARGDASVARGDAGVARADAGVARGDAGPTPAQRAATGTMLALDRAAFGAGRPLVIESLIAASTVEPLVAQSRNGAPQGFALARPGRLATHIGPIIASDSGVALQLLDGMLARLAGREVCLDLHRGGWLAPEALAERGLTLRRGLLRMIYGAPQAAGTARSFCASAGPEFG